MPAPIGFPRRVLTKDEERSLEVFRVRTARLVARTGLRGLDADATTEEVVEIWFLAGAARARYSPPTLLDVRSAVVRRRRAEARRHAREVIAAAASPRSENPLESLSEAEERLVLLRTMRRVVQAVPSPDRRALAMLIRGSTLSEVAQALGGSESSWSRRKWAAIARLRRALGDAGHDADGTVSKGRCSRRGRELGKCATGKNRGGRLIRVGVGMGQLWLASGLCMLLLGCAAFDKSSEVEVKSDRANLCRMFYEADERRVDGNLEWVRFGSVEITRCWMEGAPAGGVKPQGTTSHATEWTTADLIVARVRESLLSATRFYVKCERWEGREGEASRVIAGDSPISLSAGGESVKVLGDIAPLGLVRELEWRKVDRKDLERLTDAREISIGLEGVSFRVAEEELDNLRRLLRSDESGRVGKLDAEIGK